MCRLELWDWTGRGLPLDPHDKGGIRGATRGQSSQSDSSQLNTDDRPEHKTAAVRNCGRERERGRGGRVTLSNKHAARETTETVIPPKALTLRRETNKSILLFQDKRSHNTRGGIIYCSSKPKEEGCSWMQF